MEVQNTPLMKQKKIERGTEIIMHIDEEPQFRRTISKIKIVVSQSNSLKEIGILKQKNENKRS